jgi:hypothetical protein
MLRGLFVVLSLLGSTLSYAADEDIEIVPAPSKKSIEADSSEHHRMNKSYIFDAQVLGFGPNYMSSQGLSAGYFLNRNMIVSIEGTFGKSDNDSSLFSSSSDTYDIKGRSVGVHFKHFVGNSFYYRAGLDYRTVDYKYSYTSTVSSTYDERLSFKGKSFAVTFNIGNQWQFENFNIGCDWVGITLPVSHSISDEVQVSNYTSNRLKGAEDDYAKKSMLNLLRFYLGATF